MLKIKSRKVSNVLRKKKSISTYGPSHPELLSSYIQASVLYLVSPTSKLGREHPVSSDHLWSASSEWERSGFSGKVLNCCHRKMERIHASFHRPEFLPIKILLQIVATVEKTISSSIIFESVSPKMYNSNSYESL